MAQNTATVKQLHAMVEDDTLSYARLRVILKGIASSFYYAGEGDLVCKEQDVAVLMAGSVSADLIHTEDRIVRMI